jgi:hypothetical protein
MTRIQTLTALILAAASLSGCSTEQRGAVEAADPERVAWSTPTEARPTISEEWGCSPGQVSGFITDPVVYPTDLSLQEVLSKIDGGTGDIDSNTGRLASVTFRNEQGLIVRRVEFERSETVGWHIERGRAC